MTSFYLAIMCVLFAGTLCAPFPPLSAYCSNCPVLVDKNDVNVNRDIMFVMLWLGPRHKLLWITKAETKVMLCPIHSYGQNVCYKIND